MPERVLKKGQPHVAIVLLWYPLFTQPFIFREVENLGAIMPLEVYTLYDKNLRHCSKEMIAASARSKTYGARSLPGVCWEMLKQIVKQPALMGRLFRRSLLRRWTSLETFGENLWGFWLGPSLARRFREDGIDFIYAPWPRGAATAAWVASSLSGIPFGISARGDNLAPADPDLADKLSASCLIRANNATDKERIKELLPHDKEIALIYNSLTLPPPGKEPPKRFTADTLRLLAVGRFDVTKGFDVLLRACALLKERGVHFRLTLAGGGGKVMGLGSLGRELSDLRSSLNLEQQVDMPGLISHDALPDILTSHDIFIAPCVVDSSGRQDGIPNTVIEALAYGMPVISTDAGALPEIIKDNDTGLIIPQRDPVALADAVQSLAASPLKAEQLGANGARLARELFDAGINASRLADMFMHASNAGNICAA